MTNLSFGKYRGRSLADVLAIEPEYVGWAISKGLIEESSLDAEMLEDAISAYEDEQLEKVAFEAAHDGWGDRD